MKSKRKQHRKKDRREKKKEIERVREKKRGSKIERERAHQRPEGESYWFLFKHFDARWVWLVNFSLFSFPSEYLKKSLHLKEF